MKRSNNPTTLSRLPCVSGSSYLPPEIWAQILSKLPAKTLLKSRCVCKSWCFIMDDPNFVHMHYFQHFQINNKLLVALEGIKKFGDQGHLGVAEYKGWQLTVCEAIPLRKTHNIFTVPNKDCRYRILGSCNGLLLVVQSDGIFCRSEYRLWNPSIRKSLVLPTSPLNNYWSQTWHLFGFAPDSQDYKVVVFTFDKIKGTEPRKVIFAVYTLGDRQWTVRNDPLNVANLNVFEYLSTAVYFRGVAYWLGQNDIQSFDLDKENVTFLELPFSPDETDSVKFLFLLQGSLAVFTISKVTSSIWVMEQDNKKGPWTLCFSGKSSCDGYNLFRDGFRKKIFYCQRNGGYFVYGNKAYNIVSCQVQVLDSYMSSCLTLEEYSESLVLSEPYKARNWRKARDLRKYP